MQTATAKKIIGIVITLTVETGILILAFLGVAERINEGVTDVTGVTKNERYFSRLKHFKGPGCGRRAQNKKSHFNEMGL